MKIVVLGDGILAKDFKRMDFEVIDCDFRDFKIEFVLDYDVIINTYKYIPKNANPDEIVKVRKCNIDLPFLLSEYCNTKGKRLVHLSTAKLYVHQPSPSTELGPICAEDVYAASRLIGESACNKKDLIIRTANIFNDQPNNENVLFNTIVNPTPHKNLESYTWSIDIIRAITVLLKGKCSGVFNVSSDGVASQSEICYNVGIEKYTPILDAKLGNYVIMDISKLKEYFIPSDAISSIKKCFGKLKGILENND